VVVARNWVIWPIQSTPRCDDIPWVNSLPSLRRGPRASALLALALAASLGTGAASFANRLQSTTEQQWSGVGDVSNIAKHLESLQGLRITSSVSDAGSRVAVRYTIDSIYDQLNTTFDQLEKRKLLTADVKRLRTTVKAYENRITKDFAAAVPPSMKQTTVLDPLYVPVREAVGELQLKMTRAAIRSGKITNTLSWTVYPALFLLCGLMVVRSARHRRLVIQREAERQQANKFEAMVGSSHDVITLLDEGNRFIYVSPSASRIFGYTPNELLEQGPELLVAENELGPLRQSNAFVRETHSSQLLEVSVRNRSGIHRHFEVTGSDTQNIDGLLGTLWTWHDIDDRKRLELELKHQAFHDPLTSLANRALFQSRLEHTLVRSSRSGATTCVLFIDLDDFKTVNDSLGHGSGDIVLQHVAQSVADVIRPGDTLARLGGDEFALLLEGTEIAEALSIADALLVAAHKQITIRTEGRSDVDVSLSASIGVAATSETAMEASELLRNADMAMYAAKRTGKGCVRVYSNQLHGIAKDRLHSQSELRHAIEAGELELFYQPLVDLVQGSVSGFEALIRWNHPERGLLSPAFFIDIAEESGLIVEIGQWVIRNAAQGCATLNAQLGRTFKMNANVSPNQLRDKDLVSTVEKAVKDNGLDPYQFVLEITETALIDETGGAQLMLDRLKALGVRLALDDFGTGFSTLSSLRSLPVDIVKIDRSFVANSFGEDDRTQLLTEAIVQLGRQLGLSTVAEGIENAQQLDRMRSLGCDTGQGYLFSRPVPIKEVAETIERIERELAAGSHTGKSNTGNLHAGNSHAGHSNIVGASK
jgi:diguanylate cyclase (GGDEF)-like protein/PAS domain S-box-containing protein